MDKYGGILFIFFEVGVLFLVRFKVILVVWFRRLVGFGGFGFGGGRSFRFRLILLFLFELGSGVGLIFFRSVLEGREEGGVGFRKFSWELVLKVVSGESWEEDDEMGLFFICSFVFEFCFRRKGSLVRCFFSSISMREFRLSWGFFGFVGDDFSVGVLGLL